MNWHSTKSKLIGTAVALCICGTCLAIGLILR